MPSIYWGFPNLCLQLRPLFPTWYLHLDVYFRHLRLNISKTKLLVYLPPTLLHLSLLLVHKWQVYSSTNLKDTLGSSQSVTNPVGSIFKIYLGSEHSPPPSLNSLVQAPIISHRDISSVCSQYCFQSEPFKTTSDLSLLCSKPSSGFSSPSAKSQSSYHGLKHPTDCSAWAHCHTSLTPFSTTSPRAH